MPCNDDMKIYIMQTYVDLSNSGFLYSLASQGRVPEGVAGKTFACTSSL